MSHRQREKKRAREREPTVPHLNSVDSQFKFKGKGEKASGTLCHNFSSLGSPSSSWMSSLSALLCTIWVSFLPSSPYLAKMTREGTLDFYWTVSQDREELPQEPEGESVHFLEDSFHPSPK